MKKIYTILLALAALLAVGCTRELNVDRQDGDVLIRIALDDMEVKSAPTAGEKKVNSLYVYVFKSDGTTPLYYSGKLENPTLVSGENYYEQSTNLTALGASEADVKTAKVFALANYPGSDLNGSETLAELKAKTLSGIVPDALVMRAEGGFTSGGTNLTVANLSLKHVASKVVLKVKFPTSSVVTTGTDVSFGATTITWTPMTNDTNFRVMLQNAVSNGKVDGSAVTSPTPFDYPVNYMQDNGSEGFISPEFYSYPFEWTAAADTEPYIKVILPWSFVTTADQDGTPVVINRNIVERYYKIMLKDLTKFESNTCYMPEVTLTVKAGEENEPILVMPDGLRVLPWGLVGGPGGAQLSNVVVTDRKFIAVASSELKAERGAKASFEVFASGPLNMVIKNIYRTKYIKTKDPSTIGEVGTEMTDNEGNKGKRNDYIVKDEAINSYTYTTVTSETEPYDYTTWIDEGGLNPLQWVGYKDNGTGGTITLQHALSNNINSVDFAVTPYVYELELSLDSDPSFKKAVKIVQIPSILATNELSKGYVYINNQSNRDAAGFTNPKDVTTNAPVYVTTRMSDYYYASRPNATNILGYLPRVDLNTYSTKCKYRFLFKIVPYDDVHTIADTRVPVTGDDAFVFTRRGSGESYVTGLPITESYYSAIATASNVSYLGGTTEPDFVSPGLMVASSYGAISGSVHFGGALLRCATYQEDGYPAGRWRLPTEAELQFLVQLQKKKIIPAIVADGTWASSGRVYSNSKDSFEAPSQSTGHTCRCVYDTWYWGEEAEVGNTTYTVKVTK